MDIDQTTVIVLSIVYAVVLLGGYVWLSIALSRVFPKLGEEGWKAWVPVLREMTVFQLGGYSSAWVVSFFLPVANIAGLVVTVLAVHRINAKLGRPAVFTLLAVVAYPVWATVVGLGFGGGGRVPRPVQAQAGAPQAAAPFPPVAAPVPFLPVAAPTAQPAAAPAPFAAPFAAPSPVPFPSAAPAPVPAPAPVAAPAPVPSAAPVRPPAAPPAPPAPPVRSAPQARSAPPAPPALVDPMPGANHWSPPPAPPTPAAPIAAPPIPSAATPAPATPAPVTPAPVTPAPATPPTAFPTLPTAETDPAPAPAIAPATPPATNVVHDNEHTVAPSAVPRPAAGLVPADLAPDDLDDDFEDTVIVNRREELWVLTPAGADPIRVTRPVALLGRNPSVSAEHPDAQLIRLTDPARTVSKTHARIELVSGDWLIIDLASTNGVYLAGEGDAADVELEANVPSTLTPGFRLGELSFRLERED